MLGEISASAEIAELFKMRLQDDVRQQAALEILSGKPLDVAIRHARAEIARQMKPSGWSSFDEDVKDGVPLCDRVAAPEKEEFESWRATVFDTATESLLATLAGGTAALGRVRGVTQRRAQQIIKENLERRSRGDLFGGEGEVA